MRKELFLLTALLLPILCLYAQKDYKVVFDLTSKDSLDQKAVVRWVNEITKTEPTAQVEVVMYGQGLFMVVKGKSTVEDAIASLSSNKNVSFKVCQVAMKNQHVDQAQLIPGVQTVPDGIYEIISRQKNGWGYIKAVH